MNCLYQKISRNFIHFILHEGDFCLYICHLFVWSNFNFLYNSQWITFPTQSCLVLYFLCASLLHSLIMWLIVSFLSLHYRHLLFCCLLSILTLVWLVLMALFSASLNKEIHFLSKISLSWLYASLLEWDLANFSLEMPIQLFFSSCLFLLICSFESFPLKR